VALEHASWRFVNRNASAFGSPSDLVDAVFVLLWAGVLALGIAFAGLHTLLRGSRAGQIAAWLGIAGSALLAAFAVQTTIEVARTGGRAGELRSLRARIPTDLPRAYPHRLAAAAASCGSRMGAPTRRIRRRRRHPCDRRRSCRSSSVRPRPWPVRLRRRVDCARSRPPTSRSEQPTGLIPSVAGKARTGWASVRECASSSLSR
jgi:hypothetical protein